MHGAAPLPESSGRSAGIAEHVVALWQLVQPVGKQLGKVTKALGLGLEVVDGAGKHMAGQAIKGIGNLLPPSSRPARSFSDMHDKLRQQGWLPCPPPHAWRSCYPCPALPVFRVCGQ